MLPKSFCGHAPLLVVSVIEEEEKHVRPRLRPAAAAAGKPLTAVTSLLLRRAVTVRHARGEQVTA
jgi:hypothetical protein